MEHGASRLVYTSTYNVVFGGQEIRNGDESTISYLPLDKVQMFTGIHVDMHKYIGGLCAYVIHKFVVIPRQS